MNIDTQFYQENIQELFLDTQSRELGKCILSAKLGRKIVILRKHIMFQVWRKYKE